jgi:hypothetical protein
LIFPILIAAGWVCSHNRPNVTRIVARCVALLAGVSLGMIAISGQLRSLPAVADFHKWMGRGMLIVQWLGIPFAAGVILRQQIRSHMVVAIGYSLALVCTLVVSFLASITGYLGPLNNPETTEETRNRFVILHMFVLPAMLAILRCVWFFALRPLTESSPEKSKV